MNQYKLTAEQIAAYGAYLRQEDRARGTVEKYLRDLAAFARWLGSETVSREAPADWKRHLLSRRCAPATINSMLASLNSFFRFMGWESRRVKFLKVQRRLFRDESRELSRSEYVRLVNAARREGNQRLSLILQTICATGIRVSELRFITAEAVRTGRAELFSKGKWRVVFLPGRLRSLLQKYLQGQKKTAGAVFTTRAGKPLDRSNIWRDMKRLCKSAEVAPEKVFPHNLRRLFARTHYSMEKDLSRLADILGHSSVGTTRIYTAESGAVHARQLDRLNLVLTT